MVNSDAIETLREMANDLASEREAVESVIRAGKTYVTTLRQLAYASDPGIFFAAKRRADEEGAAWFAALRKIGMDD